MNRRIFIRNGELVTIINIKWRLLSSIRTKLFVALVAIGIIPLLLLSMSIFTSIKENHKSEKETEMLRQANTISTNLSITNYFDNNDRNIFLDNIQTIISDRIVILNNVGEVVYDSNGYDYGKLYTVQPIIEILQGDEKHLIESDELFVRVYTPIYDTPDKRVIGVTILTGSNDQITVSISRMSSTVFLIITGLSFIIILLNIYFSGLITKPFSEFVSHIKRVSEGYIDERIVIKGNYEIEEIGEAFNEMLGKIEEIDQSRQQFVANVSHELKTPLTSMKVLAEALLTQEDVTIEFYREFMEDINSEVDRETKIINDLLTLVTLDKKENQLKISTVNINELIEQVMRMLKPVAEKKGIVLEIKSYREVVAKVDETKMYLVFMNLIENAIKYNRENGKITVTINSNHRDMSIKVIDTGVGIPENDVEKIFERFYRVDKNRSRATGGTGLGLSIVHKTVLMHGGSIRCSSVEKIGTTFSLKIPLSQYYL